MPTPEQMRAEREAGQPVVRDATLDELREVYNDAAIAQMNAAGMLTKTQARDWAALQPASPAFGAPVPPS